MAEKTSSLNELFRLTFSAPVTWIWGEANSQHTIHWVSLGLPEAQPGDLLLINASELNSQVILQAQEKKLTALLLLGAALLAENIDPGDLVIAAVDEPVPDLRSLQRTMLTILINQRIALMERGVGIRTRFSELGAEGGGWGGG